MSSHASSKAFCGSCKWQSIECDARLEFLVQKYGKTEDTIKKELVEKDVCVDPNYEPDGSGGDGENMPAPVSVDAAEKDLPHVADKKLPEDTDRSSSLANAGVQNSSEKRQSGGTVIVEVIILVVLVMYFCMRTKKTTADPSSPSRKHRLDRKISSELEKVYLLKEPKSRWVVMAVVGFVATSSLVSSSRYLMSDQSISTWEQNSFKSAGANYNAGVGMQQCSSLFNSTISAMWSNIGEKIMNASHFPTENAANENFTKWVDTLFQTKYQVHQLRQSAVHPPDPMTTLRLLQIIHDRVEFLKKGDKEQTKEAPPLHILVMGGSVTAGMRCGVNHVGIKIPDWRSPQFTCAWPARLENMFNALFEGKKVVKVSNLAAGGASSEVGKVVMEYQLFSEEVKKSLPHVVIWAHAPNDSQEADKAAVEYQSIPAFVHAARSLRMCDEELPLVVMLEDFYGAKKYTDINEISTMVYKASSWYGLMGVSHLNMIKHDLFARFNNDTFVTGMTGSTWDLHPGMFGHIGIAWALLFNFLKAFTETCEDDFTLRYGRIGKDDNDSPPIKHLSSYQKDETVQSLNERWKKESDSTRQECSNDRGTISEVCTYAWMVNLMTGVSQTRHVDAMLKSVLVHNDGWKASGYPVRQPRTGWYAQSANAEFSLKVVASFETKFLTLMAMRSYGDNFKDTMLKVLIHVKSNEKEQKVLEHSISGFHTTKTSIHIPHKMELPGGGAKKGDTILVEVKLVSGAYFKINGIALCTY